MKEFRSKGLEKRNEKEQKREKITNEGSISISPSKSAEWRWQDNAQKPLGTTCTKEPKNLFLQQTLNPVRGQTKLFQFKTSKTKHK